MRLLTLALILLNLPAFAQDGQTVVMWNGTPLIIDEGGKPQKHGRGESFTLPAPRITMDDAPAPHRAPQREDVDMTSLPAPFGLMEAAAAPPRPRYSPVLSITPKKTVIKPGAKPQAPEDATFTISFRRIRIDVLDNLPRWQNAKLPVSLGPNLALFLQAVSLTAQKTPHARIVLEAYASERGGQSTARQVSMARALAVYQWLVDQGVRPTRIDWRAEGIAHDGGEPDRVDIDIR